MVRLPLSQRIKKYCPVDVEALLEHARNVRGAVCSCSLVDLITGSESIILPLRFEDGEEWIAKLPWKHAGDDIYNLDPVEIESEVATMRFVSENTQIPVPTVFDYAINSDTPIHWPYIWMSKAPGVSLREIGWSGLTLKQQCKVMQELGNVLYQLSTIHFDRIGSLVFSENGYALTRCMRPAFIPPTGLRDLPTNSGPFESSEKYYRSLLSVYRAEISKPNSGSRCPFLSPLPLRRNYPTQEAFRAGESIYNDPDNLTVEDQDSDLNIAQYQRLCDELETSIPDMLDFNRTTFGLENPDLNQSNIFLGSDLKISCIIDWECASTVPWESLCIPPHLPARQEPLRVELRSAFEASVRELKSLDKIAPRMLCTLHGKIWRMSTIDDRERFSVLLSRPKPMWAYDRLVQNEASIEFHPILDELLSWKLGLEWRVQFGNYFSPCAPSNHCYCGNLHRDEI